MTAPVTDDGTAPAFFSCTGIKAGYGEITIVPSFDLAAEPGTVVTILGPNGAGKTTLMMTLAGLLPAQAGSVAVAGKQIKVGRAAASNHAGVVLVPDDRALFATLTVEENIKTAQGKRRGKVDLAFEMFPALAERRKLTAGNLSGGEQQMLAIARAVVQEPRVLLIDEMSMGLAPVIVERLLPLVRQVADEMNAVVVLVEQHVALALEIGDRAIVLVHGAVALDRPAKEMRGNLAALEAAYFGETIPGADELADPAAVETETVAPVAGADEPGSDPSLAGPNSGAGVDGP